MPTLTVENYLKTLLQINIRTESDWVSTGKLAEAMHVSPGTVTSMLKTLADSGLANYKPYEGATLTDPGRHLALRMLRRHRLLELFLVKTLDLTWDQVHEEAEDMEHAVSDVLIDRIDEYLGRPEFDPHGDPIPAENGDMRGDTDSAVPLTKCPSGSRVRIVRVLNQNSEFLRYLSENGLELGGEGLVSENSFEAGLVTIRFDDRPVSMGHQAARNVLIESIID